MLFQTCFFLIRDVTYFCNAKLAPQHLFVNNFLTEDV